MYKSFNRNKDYKKLQKEISRREAILEKSVTKEQMKLYYDISEVQNELDAVENEDSFIYGFKSAYDLHRDTL